jgi:hypothetical protein
MVQISYSCGDIYWFIVTYVGFWAHSNTAVILPFRQFGYYSSAKALSKIFNKCGIDAHQQYFIQTVRCLEDNGIFGVLGLRVI